ncbi:hypothetical protein FQR65_LT10770 [Abscondita terminalis]|nr:hypothetical protein FQR65_LT10770 [Abscondita terminalis]
MDSVCRTCLCIIRNGCVLNPVHQLKPDSEVTDRHKLEACVPELSVDIVLEPVICKSCKESLALAYHFKTMCIESEKTLYNYIQRRRQNENCTNLLNNYDLLALVRNDIILEHNYSSVKNHEEIAPQNKDVVESKVDALDSSDKRTLRPRHINSDVNGNKIQKIIKQRAKQKKCKLCKKLLSSKTSLQRHMRSHRSFACATCKKTYTHKTQLIIHIRTHRPFVCTVCKISFKQKSHLMGHVRIHNGKKSFRCNKCPKRFLKSGPLRIHKIKEHVNGSNKITFPQNDLNEINSSNEIRRSQRLKYVCEVCRRGFASNYSRTRHVQHQHGNQ